MASTPSIAKAKLRRRRWWRLQFRLRSLLGLVLLASCIMGAWRTWIRPYERQHQALVEISIYANHIEGEPGRPVWLQPLFKPEVFWDVTHVESECREIDLAPVAYFPRLKSLKLNGTGISDASLTHIAGLSQLETLSLNHTRVTGAGLAHLRRLKNLKKLDLGYTQVHGSGLVHLADLTKLEELTLDNLVIVDEHLECLSGLTELRTLSLKQTDIRGNGLGVLNSWPKLRTIAVSSDQLQEVNLRDLPALEWAYFSGAVLGSMRYDMRDCPALVYLQLRGGIAEIRLRSLPLFESFTLVDAHRLEWESSREKQDAAGRYEPAGAALTLIDLPKLEVLRIDLNARLSLDLQKLSALATLHIVQADGMHLRCQELNSLYSLTLQNCTLNESLGSPPAQLPNVRALEIDNVVSRRSNRNAMKEPLTALLQHLPDLEYVEIGGPSLNGASLEPLIACPKLRQIELRNMHIDRQHLESLAELSTLRSLAVNNCRLRPGAMPAIGRLTQLEELEFSETRLGDHDVAALSNLSRLKKLSFEATKISSDALVHLYCLPNLEWVNFPISSRNPMVGNKAARDYSEIVVDFEFIPTIAELREFSRALPAQCFVRSLATHSNGLSSYDLVGGRRVQFAK